jgi:hypothetical protein
MGARPRTVAPPTEAPPGLMLCQPRPHGEDDDEKLSLGMTPWGALSMLPCRGACCAVRRTATVRTMGALPIAAAPLSALLR